MGEYTIMRRGWKLCGKMMLHKGQPNNRYFVSYIRCRTVLSHIQYLLLEIEHTPNSNLMIWFVTSVHYCPQRHYYFRSSCTIYILATSSIYNDSQIKETHQKPNSINSTTTHHICYQPNYMCFPFFIVGRGLECCVHTHTRTKKFPGGKQPRAMKSHQLACQFRVHVHEQHSQEKHSPAIAPGPISSIPNLGFNSINQPYQQQTFPYPSQISD